MMPMMVDRAEDSNSNSKQAATGGSSVQECGGGANVVQCEIGCCSAPGGGCAPVLGRSKPMFWRRSL